MFEFRDEIDINFLFDEVIKTFSLENPNFPESYESNKIRFELLPQSEHVLKKFLQDEIVKNAKARTELLNIYSNTFSNDDVLVIRVKNGFDIIRKTDLFVQLLTRTIIDDSTFFASSIRKTRISYDNAYNILNSTKMVLTPSLITFLNKHYFGHVYVDSSFKIEAYELFYRSFVYFYFKNKIYFKNKNPDKVKCAIFSSLALTKIFYPSFSYQCIEKNEFETEFFPIFLRDKLYELGIDISTLKILHSQDEFLNLKNS